MTDSDRQNSLKPETADDPGPAEPAAPESVAAPLVSVRDLHRRFGKLHAVRGVSFDIHRGQVAGFIGANGAGKTTTMRIMATLDTPDQGEVSIDGLSVIDHPFMIRHKVGWMPDAYGAYPNMTVIEYLDFFSRSFGFQGEDRRKRIDEVMEFTELTPLAERPMNSLSKGMGQRLCLGRTLIHDPPVLILDEPAAGLDPKARVEFKHLVRLLADEGKTILISSHILTELGEMCDTLIFIDEGKIVHHGDAASMTSGGNTNGASIIVEVAGEVAPLEQWVSLQQSIRVTEVRKNGCVLQLDDPDPAATSAVLRRMLNDGLIVVGFQREQIRLEDAFINLLGKLRADELSPPSPPPLPNETVSSNIS